MDLLSDSDLFYIMVIRKGSFSIGTLDKVKNGTSTLWLGSRELNVLGNKWYINSVTQSYTLLSCLCAFVGKSSHASYRCVYWTMGTFLSCTFIEVFRWSMLAKNMNTMSPLKHILCFISNAYKQQFFNWLTFW